MKGCSIQEIHAITLHYDENLERKLRIFSDVSLNASQFIQH